MAEERNTRREVLRKLLTLGPLAAAAAVFGNGAKQAEAADFNENVNINGGLYVRDNAGIGISASTKLHVSSSGTVISRVDSTSTSGARDAQVVLYVHNNGGDDAAGSVVFKARNNSGVETAYAQVISNCNIGSVSGHGTLALRTAYGGALNTAMTINPSGYVGIGTATPVYPLDVVGDIRCSGVFRGTVPVAQSSYYAA